MYAKGVCKGCLFVCIIEFELSFVISISSEPEITSDIRLFPAIFGSYLTSHQFVQTKCLSQLKIIIIKTM